MWSPIIGEVYRTPRIPRSLLDEYREGLLVGTACDEGELLGSYAEGPEPS
ncbi:hypothetical protein ACV56Z_03930 [Staphylococcus aureus]